MVTLVFEYSKPKEFNGFVTNMDQVSFMDLDEFNKYLKGEAAYNFIDDSVKRNDDEKLLYAFEDDKIVWVNNTDINKNEGIKYAILQLAEGDKTRYKRNISLNTLYSMYGSPNCNDYEFVYFGSIRYKENSELGLENIYKEFNSGKLRPGDYYGTSLSMSDVILIENEDKIQAYYCDRFGFTPLSDSFVTEQLKEKFNCNLDVKKEYMLLGDFDNFIPISIDSSINLRNRYGYLDDNYGDIFLLADKRSKFYLNAADELNVEFLEISKEIVNFVNDGYIDMASSIRNINSNNDSVDISVIGKNTFLNCLVNVVTDNNVKEHFTLDVEFPDGFFSMGADKLVKQFNKYSSKIVGSLGINSNYKFKAEPAFNDPFVRKAGKGGI